MKKYAADTWILSSDMVAPDICKLVVENPYPEVEVKAGQFFSIKPAMESSKLLRRPISVCEVSKNQITFLIKTLGKGTKTLSELKKGEKLDVMGPLGNGFEVLEGKKALVVGGGIGTAPLVQLLEVLKEQGQDNVRTLLGYRERPYALELFEKHTSNIITASELYAAPHKGYVTEFMVEALKTETYEIVYACGPEPMLACIQAVCAQMHVPVQLSIEERMACGIGACLVCTCKVKDEQDEEGFKNVRSCKEGPVFYGDEVMLHV